MGEVTTDLGKHQHMHDRDDLHAEQVRCSLVSNARRTMYCLFSVLKNLPNRPKSCAISRIHTVLPSIIDIINNYLLVWIFDWYYFILLYVMNRLKENFAKNSKLPSKDSVRRSRPSPRERSSLTLPSESWDSTEPHSEVQCCCSPPVDVWSTSQNGYMVFFCL